MIQNVSDYPRFISDKPAGLDCFKGHSQERLAHSICDYMRKADAVPDGKEQKMSSMPRIIGLEGGWGSGKSNVVSMVEKVLAKDGCYIFTYDAWGHQEDLQRRSILETMTGQLIKDGVLQGKVKIQLRNGKDYEAAWNDHLSLLLSNKTTTIRKSTPKLTSAAFRGIGIVALFAICSLVAGQLIENVDDFKCWWWIDAIPVALAAVVACAYRIKDGCWDNIFRMVDHTNNDTIDEEYTSSEEPSVAEFKNWMRAISDYLGSDSKRLYRKLVIVFDNMDRLPSEKVMQLWSSIYSFFAGGEFEKIWVVIPYDYKHLCHAICGNGEDESAKKENAERIKHFISKTFPITYHVPQPVITDYEELFYTYFDMAFGKGEHDRKHICQVFTHLRPQANPRTVIRFVNELVAMRLQWNDKKYRLQNLALYILKKDYIHYDEKGLDVQLLSVGLFDEIGAFYPDKDKVRTELCQYAYGLDDENMASELPLSNELKRQIDAGGSVKDYFANPAFLSVIEKLINKIDAATIDNAVKSMVSLDGAEQTAEEKESIQAKWDFLANKKKECRYEKHAYDETLTILANHATEKRVKEMGQAFAKAMQEVKVTDGAAYFKAQDRLQQALKEAKVAFDDKDWYKSVTCPAEQFVQYVCEAKDAYTHYGLTCEKKALNEYLLNGAISGNSAVATVVDHIKDDGRYDLSDLKTGLEQTIADDSIKENITVVAYVHRVLDTDDGILAVRFKKETVASYQNATHAPWEDELPVGLEDVLAMSLADGKDLNQIDDRILPKVSGCMGRYLTYTDLLKNTGKDGSAFRKLNVYCMEHRVGGSLNLTYAARHLNELHNALGTDMNVMMKHFNQWPAVKWGELNADNEYVKDVKNYVHQSFFGAYKDTPGKFSDSIIALGVASIGLQNTGFLASQQSYTRQNVFVIDSYWKEFVETYLGTKYLPEAGVLLTTEAITMLQWLYDKNEEKDVSLMDVILSHADAGTLRSYLHGMMNAHLSKTDITKVKFLLFGKLLPMLGADMDTNTARGLMTHFVRPVYKEAECASVIVAHKDFYLSIMKQDTAMAAGMVMDMVDMDAFAGMAKEIRKLVSDSEKKGEREK